MSAETREAIVHNLLTLRRTPKQAFNEIFLGSSQELKYASFQKIVRMIMKMSSGEIASFVEGPVSRKVAGRSRKYSTEARSAIVQLRLRHHTAKLEVLRSTFQAYFTDNGDSVPSKSTISRVARAGGITRKVLEVRNIRVDPKLQLEYLDRIAPINPANIIDIDETLCTADQFHNKYGWSPEGEPALFAQLHLGGVSNSTIAAYTPMGFICWTVYNTTITGMQVQDFLFTDVRPFMNDSSFIVLDNASVHKTDEVKAALEVIAPAQYTYCAPYSPELKPVELGFANVKRWLREHEQEAVQAPLDYINQAFSLYSVNGARSSAGKLNLFLLCL